MPPQLNKCINEIDKNKYYFFLAWNMEVYYIVNKFTSVTITYHAFTEYTSTQLNYHKEIFEYHLKVFITNHLENIERPWLFYEWYKTLIWNCINISAKKKETIIEEEVTPSFWLINIDVTADPRPNIQSTAALTIEFWSALLLTIEFSLSRQW